MNETTILISILLLLVALYFLTRRRRNAAADDHHDHHDGADGVCCGRHAVCDKGLDRSHLYFDDEELDRFAERQPEEYTEAEAEEFRNVLYTMNGDEVDTWVKCLQARRIELPQQVKDEVLSLLR